MKWSDLTEEVLHYNIHGYDPQHETAADRFGFGSAINGSSTSRVNFLVEQDFFFFPPGEIFIISSNDITEMTSCSDFKHNAHTQKKVTSKFLRHNIRMRMRKCINIQMEIDLSCTEEKEETLKAI